MEHHLLVDLGEFMAETRTKKIDVVVIGGLAVRAYTGATRFTHDVDLIARNAHFGIVRKSLKDMGYRGSAKQFGRGRILFAEKHFEDRRAGMAYNLSMDISIDSVGAIFDHSSSTLYRCTDRLFEEAPWLPVSGYYPTSSSLSVITRVLSVQDLFLLKMVTKAYEGNGREKDILDVFLLSLHAPLEPAPIWRAIHEQEALGNVGFGDYIKNQIRFKLFTKSDQALQEIAAKQLVEFSRADLTAIRLNLRAILESEM